MNSCGASSRPPTRSISTGSDVPQLADRSNTPGATGNVWATPYSNWPESRGFRFCCSAAQGRLCACWGLSLRGVPSDCAMVITCDSRLMAAPCVTNLGAPQQYSLPSKPWGSQHPHSPSFPTPPRAYRSPLFHSADVVLAVSRAVLVSHHVKSGPIRRSKLEKRSGDTILKSGLPLH